MIHDSLNFKSTNDNLLQLKHHHPNRLRRGHWVNWWEIPVQKYRYSCGLTEFVNHHPRKGRYIGKTCFWTLSLRRQSFQCDMPSWDI